MAATHTADLAAIDRDVARAFAAWSRWRARLAADPAAHADEDPLAPWRRVAGQSTWRELGALDVVVIDRPVRDALRRWVYALLQARLSRDLDVAWARAATDARGRFRGEPPAMVSWRDAWRGVVGDPAGADRWLDAAIECAPPLAAVARERAARRLEVARRVGLAHPHEDSPVPLDALHAAARALLARTDDLARSLAREGRRGDAHPVDAIVRAVARDAGEGWPARASTRWLEELFGDGVRDLDLSLRLSDTLGASSFARALGGFGFALRVAAGAKLPRFALAREPAFVGAHRFALLFASLAASPDFHRVALGNGRRVALGQARSLARAALFDARLAAVRLLLGDERAFAPRDLFEELATRLLDAPLAPELAGAWPAARDDEPARALALFTTLPLARDMVDRFDVDWFRNPRALPHLRALGAVPAREETPLPDDAAASLARAFEEALA